jgi:signal transduction histidine kinase
MVALIVGANLILINLKQGDSGRPYRVEAERIAYDIEHGKEPDLSGYKYVTNYVKLDIDLVENIDIFTDSDMDSLFRVVNGDVYRFEYRSGDEKNIDKTQIVMNIVLGSVALLVIIILIYIRFRIIGPFNRMTELPAELAKGNITTPIKADKNKYFGNFLWGLDLLRDRLEKGRQQDLESKKNNQALILSLSHDIKTPLSIIELNAKALERGLYDNNKEKKDRIAGVINEKCSEIKTYVDQIIQASREDFLELEVKDSEFYLCEVMDSIKSVYREKMDLLMIDLDISECSDCLLKGDADRAVEVLQNLLENAIKYGDERYIKIRFSREENSQLISVINSGCTLKDTELPHIFDSFWRGSNTGSNAGSGLGLYICKHIMNRMNGDIFAEIRDGNMVVTAVFGMA